jgi:hypothetical protein
LQKCRAEAAEALEVAKAQIRTAPVVELTGIESIPDADSQRGRGDGEFVRSSSNPAVLDYGDLSPPPRCTISRVGNHPGTQTVGTLAAVEAEAAAAAAAAIETEAVVAAEQAAAERIIGIQMEAAQAQTALAAAEQEAGVLRQVSNPQLAPLSYRTVSIENELDSAPRGKRQRDQEGRAK